MGFFTKQSIVQNDVWYIMFLYNLIFLYNNSTYAVNVIIDCHSRESGNPYFTYWMDHPVEPDDDRIRKS